MFKFSKSYFLLTILLFLTEVLIGSYVHDGIIRPYGGDFLVVILIYCFVKSFFNTPVLKTAVYFLLFSYVVEVSQYFHLVNLLGWQNSKAACIIMGTYFSVVDLACYTLGILVVIIIEKKLNYAKQTKK